MWSRRGPWAPSSIFCSMSPVREGPVTKLTVRPQRADAPSVQEVAFSGKESYLLSEPARQTALTVRDPLHALMAVATTVAIRINAADSQ